MMGRGAERLVRAFTHHDDAHAESLGILDHRGEVAVVRDEDERRGRIRSGHQFHGVNRQAHVRGVLAGGVAALVDELELGPILGGGAPAAEASVEIAVGTGGGDRRFADETTQGRQVLVRDVVGVDEHTDALVRLGFGGLGGGG